MTLTILSAIATAGCSLAGGGWIDVPNSPAAGFGDVKFMHQELSTKHHLVTVSAEPRLDETEGSVVLRLGLAASRFASKMCPASFDFTQGFFPETQMSTQNTERSKRFEFFCD